MSHFITDNALIASEEPGRSNFTQNRDNPSAPAVRCFYARPTIDGIFIME